MGYSRKRKNSRVSQIAVSVGGKFCLSLGELEILFGALLDGENLRRGSDFD